LYSTLKRKVTRCWNLSRGRWKWRTWKWRNINIARHENAGRENAGHESAGHDEYLLIFVFTNPSNYSSIVENLMW